MINYFSQFKGVFQSRVERQAVGISEEKKLLDMCFPNFGIEISEPLSSIIVTALNRKDYFGQREIIPEIPEKGLTP